MLCMYVCMDGWMDGWMDGSSRTRERGGRGVGRERETLELVVAQVRPPVLCVCGEEGWGRWGRWEIVSAGSVRSVPFVLSYVPFRSFSVTFRSVRFRVFVAPPPAAALAKYRDRDSGATRVTYCD